MNKLTNVLFAAFEKLEDLTYYLGYIKCQEVCFQPKRGPLLYLYVKVVRLRNAIWRFFVNHRMDDEYDNYISKKYLID